MHILFLSQLLPYPPDAGAKVRSYYTIRWLAEKHRVTLVAFSRPEDPLQAIEHLKSFCQAVYTVQITRSRTRDALSFLGSLQNGNSFIINRDRSKVMDTLLRRLMETEQFDAIHADQLWMAQFAVRIKGQGSGKIGKGSGDMGRGDGEGGERVRMVLDEHNACYQIFERLAKGEMNQVKQWVWRREAERLKQYEAAVCRQFDQVVTVTDGDRKILEELVRTEEAVNPLFYTIPICVDTRTAEVVKARPESLNILHLGTMFWPPNVEGVAWFLKEVWPRVRAELPQASFTIAGKNPPEKLVALAAGLNVELTGYVPDPLPYLEQAGAFVVPLLSGGGMRVKVIDAWRWGMPVVSTSIGTEGIDYRQGENILIADAPDDFAMAVVRVLSDAELNQRLRAGGRRWVEEMYDYQGVYGKWDEVYGD